jgi:hypothetical protein
MADAETRNDLHRWNKLHSVRTALALSAVAAFGYAIVKGQQWMVARKWELRTHSRTNWLIGWFGPKIEDSKLSTWAFVPHTVSQYSCNPLKQFPALHNFQMVLWIADRNNRIFTKLLTSSFPYLQLLT